MTYSFYHLSFPFLLIFLIFFFYFSQTYNWLSRSCWFCWSTRNNGGRCLCCCSCISLNKSGCIDCLRSNSLSSRLCLILLLFSFLFLIFFFNLFFLFFFMFLMMFFMFSSLLMNLLFLSMLNMGSLS